MNNDFSGCAAKAIANSVWETPSVTDQPSITLVRWAVMETEGAERHFVGYNVDDREGRASTPIQSFDPVSRCGVTASGRLYRLAGPPGRDPDGEWVWSHWAGCRKLKWRDVTKEFVKLISD